mmetsp:Transcript_33571/g.75422  ORF Transcript_33571/g.75422 Transcript_33571/m.75422 type:complete len:127 (+) Transcript_33571:539-919(+)
MPEDFEWTGMCTKDAWLSWWFGNAQKGYPPLKRVFPEDFPDKNKRKRYSDFKILMTGIENCAKDKNIFVDDMSVDQAVAIFQECEPVLYEIYKARHCKCQGPGRFSQLIWMTVIDNVRKSDTDFVK